MKMLFGVLSAVLPVIAASIPPGAEISVRTMNTIHADDADETHFFPATIQRDVLDRDGHVAIPRGANAELVVRRAPGNELVLDLRAVTVDGKRYILDTEDVVEQGSNKDGVGENKRTGKFLGGGALIGGIIGAIAGGGKGAAIGAASGAAVGAGAQMSTRGRSVRVPAETVLMFKLERPVRVTEYAENRDDRNRPPR
jgi:hypothetical protein